MGKSTGKRVLITGASSGIGAALALEYAQQGAVLFLTARRLERLQALAEKIRALGGRAECAEMDVCDTASVQAATEKAAAAMGGIDILIANAGFGVVGKIETLPLDDYRRQFETNIFGVIRSVQAAYPWLKKSRGSIAVIGSVNGWVALPGNSPYSMSKHAIRAFTDALWLEAHADGIRVTHISPGFISTEIRQIDNQGKRHTGHKDPIPAWLMATPQHTAKVIRKAVEAGKREKSITGHGWWSIHLFRYFPVLMYHLLRSLKISARGEP
ncbi:SDR family NAD(P)-dependent oxidoreductase [bacterium]|nr:SDR family NAD(P)-dependent oxidoreductase [bacterium]